MAQNENSPTSFTIDDQGRLIGPDGQEVPVALGDTVIVISGGSFTLQSVGEFDDDDHPGNRTKRLHHRDTTKHITSIQLVGFKAVAGDPNKFTPDVPPSCTIIIHYE